MATEPYQTMPKTRIQRHPHAICRLVAAKLEHEWELFIAIMLAGFVCP